MRPFFSFYGGKWRDTPKKYPAPEHAEIVEPFAGSAGYATRYHDRSVVLVEKDPKIAALWRFLIGATRADIMAIPLIEDGQTVDDLGAHEEARTLVGFWLNRGASFPRKRPSSWMRSGIRPGSFWGAKVRARIAGQVGEISHWKAAEGGYQECENRRATWFVDPPYQASGRHYRFGSSLIDFDGLGDWCRTLKGQAIVCEQAGATWLPFEPIGSTKTTRKGKRSPEAVWVGGTP